MEARKMAQQFKALVALSKGLGLVPGADTGAQNHL